MRPAETGRNLHETARVLRPAGRLLGTFFLLNEASVHNLGDLDAGGELPFEFGDEEGRRFRSSSSDNPEHRIALAEADAMRAARGRRAPGR